MRGLIGAMSLHGSKTDWEKADHRSCKSSADQRAWISAHDSSRKSRPKEPPGPTFDANSAVGILTGKCYGAKHGRMDFLPRDYLHLLNLWELLHRLRNWENWLMGSSWKGPWESYHERMSINIAVCVTKTHHKSKLSLWLFLREMFLWWDGC